MHGRGKMTLPDGRVIQGQWKDNVKIEDETNHANN
jgi:hypothetical protein